jgi:hypothetical protein
VSKRKDSHCRSGRSPDWIKSKNPNARAKRRRTVTAQLVEREHADLKTRAPDRQCLNPAEGRIEGFGL